MAKRISMQLKAESAKVTGIEFNDGKLSLFIEAELIDATLVSDEANKAKTMAELASHVE